VRHRMTQRRHLAILLGTESVEPRVAGMHDEDAAAGVMQRADKIANHCVRLVASEADPVLDRDRHRHGIAYRPHAVGDQHRLGHQACAEGAALHALARAAAVQVDLRIAPRLADARSPRQRVGLAAAELQRHRLLDRIEAEQPLEVAVQHGAGGDHLGVEPRPAGQVPVEDAAVSVGPVHHRRDAEAPVVRAAGGGVDGRDRGGGGRMHRGRHGNRNRKAAAAQWKGSAPAPATRHRTRIVRKS